jgi:hypothetical protein
MGSRDFKADGSDGFYADHQAEAALKELGHSLHFHKHGSASCWQCGRYAKLDFSNPAECIWTLSGEAFDEPCEWEGIPYEDVQEGDYLSHHSVNGATYGPPTKIDRLTKTQMASGENKYKRKDGRLLDRFITSFYVSVVRLKKKSEEISEQHQETQRP